MSIENYNTFSQTISLADRAKENFRENKWQILLPGPIGVAALAATVVFLVSNPFGWAFSAGLVGAGIAFATLNAISAIGYSLYNLLKEPVEFKNSFTPIDPRCTADALIQAIQNQFGAQKEEPTPSAPPLSEMANPLLQKKIEEEVPAHTTPKTSAKKAKKPFLKPLKKPTPLPDYQPVFSRLSVEPPKPKNFLDRIYEQPAKSALLLSGLLLGGYGLYNYLTVAGETIRRVFLAMPALPAPEVLPALPMPSSYLAVATVPLRKYLKI